MTGRDKAVGRDNVLRQLRPRLLSSTLEEPMMKHIAAAVAALGLAAFATGALAQGQGCAWQASAGVDKEAPAQSAAASTADKKS